MTPTALFMICCRALGWTRGRPPKRRVPVEHIKPIEVAGSRDHLFDPLLVRQHVSSLHKCLMRSDCRMLDTFMDRDAAATAAVATS